MRVDQQPRCDGKRRSLRFLGQPADAERAADPHRTAENLRGEPGEPVELARPAGEHHASARLGRERRCRQAIAHQLQYLLDARLDDAHEVRARDELRRLPLVVVDRRHRDHVALVGAAREHAAVERLDALGVGDTGIEAASEVHGHVPAAEREAVGMHEAAAGKDRDGGGAGAHVDHGGAELGFVVGQRGQPRHIGARHHRLDVEVAALDREHEIARSRNVGGDDMHVDAEMARQHAARIADAAGVVEHVTDRQRMQYGASGAHGMAAAGGEHAGDVALADGRARDLDGGGDELARRAAGGDRDHDRIELHPGRALGEIGALPHRGFRFGEIDHRAALHAAGDRVAEADDVDRMGAPAQHVLRLARLEAPDQARDLAGPDVERGNQHRRAWAAAASSSG